AGALSITPQLESEITRPSPISSVVWPFHLAQVERAGRGGRQGGETTIQQFAELLILQRLFRIWPCRRRRDPSAAGIEESVGRVFVVDLHVDISRGAGAERIARLPPLPVDDLVLQNARQPRSQRGVAAERRFPLERGHE